MMKNISQPTRCSDCEIQAFIDTALPHRLPDHGDKRAHGVLHRMTLGVSLAFAVTLTSGCMQQHHREVEARISGAEDMAAAARVHANDAYIKAEQALKTAIEAQKSADDANRRASRVLDKK